MERMGGTVKSLLVKAGFTSNEADVYLTLLSKGCSSPADVVNNVGMHRTSVYNTLARLESKGLVNSVQIDGKRRYSPVHPQKLHESVAEQVLLVEQLMPNLERLHEQRQSGEGLQYFIGIAGLRSIYERILRESKEYWGYGPAFRIEKVLRHYLMHFTKRAIKKKIRSRMIFNQRLEELIPNPLQEQRYLVAGQLSPESVRIFGDKVAIMLLSADNPMGIVIHNKAVADGFRKRFEHLWELAEQ